MNNVRCCTTRYLIIAALAWLVTAPASIQAYEPRVEEIIKNPTVGYRKAFVIDAQPAVWNRVLDNLYLMGQIWTIYRFQPAYQVTRTELSLHVVDPTGIIGDVRQVGQEDLSRCFFGQGRFNHWAIPSFFTADGVIMFEWKSERNRILGEVKIFMLGNNWISRGVMNLFSGILTRGIDNRFTLNMEDTKKIIRDIVEKPDEVRNGLTGPLRREFNRVFSTMGMAAPEE